MCLSEVWALVLSLNKGKINTRRLSRWKGILDFRIHLLQYPLHMSSYTDICWIWRSGSWLVTFRGMVPAPQELFHIIIPHSSLSSWKGLLSPGLRSICPELLLLAPRQVFCSSIHVLDTLTWHLAFLTSHPVNHFSWSHPSNPIPIL